MINVSKFLPFFIPNVYRACLFFTNLDLFCIDNARVIYRKIQYFVLVRERPSFIHVTIYGQNCRGNCAMCSPCQIILSLLRQICALFIYDLLCDATRLRRHVTGQRARLLQTSVYFLDMTAIRNICITAVLHSLWCSSTVCSEALLCGQHLRAKNTGSRMVEWVNDAVNIPPLE